MLSLLLQKYKLAIYAVLFVIYTVGVWNVSAKYTESKYLQKQLDVAEAVIATTAKNDEIRDNISEIMEEKLAKLRPLQTTINRNITNEIAKDTVYIDCKSNPNVMREYQRKLDLQPK
jgi:predicted Holliday junction resolvase-like endonuclease